ncbi:TonB-dependent receptor domain-containing protein [Thiohalophilus thiocyanatoxydans]|uniref:Vitamin B12 transporter n=1 Tax=Thiohalophilus thiocyanatoxydans TaxID=381308 RepID=A0A4R8IPD7_9GAMM|nr:TonB-dependent receptor [Thiohalophilus thiocyanatoxydans]TDX99376.1 vitamin B12 transporter [Thiohalophilus thiocyanatoxydans]
MQIVSCRRAAIAALSTCFVLPAAQAAEEEAIIVTASRTLQSANDTLASTSIIDREQIDNSQARDVMQLLQLEAGIDMARGGGPGGSTSLFMRGTNSNHTLVLIDGVRASSATTGSFAWAHLAPSDIERIEIVRGPRAAHYGSDAVGGVIQIFTRDNKGSHVRVQGGSYNSRLVEFGTGDSKGNLDYSLNATHRDTDGFSATNSKSSFFNSDEDPYRNNSVSGKLDYRLNDDTQIAFKGWHSDSKSNFDQGTQDNQNSTGDLRLTHQSTTNWEQQLSVGYAKDENETNEPSRSSFVQTNRLMADWKHDLTLSDNALLTAGISTVEEDTLNINRITDATVYDESIRNNGLFTSLQYFAGDHDIQLSGRVDDHETFGSHNTGQAAWGYQLNEQHRLFASYGTAFQAPSSNNLFHPGYSGFYAGNSDLEPEESESFELGTKSQFGAQQLSISLYHTEIDNLISYSGTNSQAINIDKASIEGVEVVHRYQAKTWQLKSQLTLQDAVDDETGEDLDRRAGEKLSVNYTRQFENDSQLGVEWLYRSKRKDDDERLDAYQLVNLSGQYQLASDFWFEGRVDNLLDEEYELQYGYNTAGLSAYAGVRYHF